MIKINLAPERGRRRGAGFKLGLPSFNLGWLFGVVYLALLLGVGGYWWVLIRTQATLTADIDRAQKDLANELRKRVEVIEELTRAQGRPILLADAFASVIPNDLWITGFEERGGQ